MRRTLRVALGSKRNTGTSLRSGHAAPVCSARNVFFRALFSSYDLTWRKIRMALETNETGNLIGSDKVEGTAVYGADRNKIGSIERVMIDKVSGKVSYAVLGFGGFLGLGNDHYPL